MLCHFCLWMNFGSRSKNNGECLWRTAIRKSHLHFFLFAIPSHPARSAAVLQTQPMCSFPQQSRSSGSRYLLWSSAPLYGSPGRGSMMSCNMMLCKSSRTLLTALPTGEPSGWRVQPNIQRAQHISSHWDKAQISVTTLNLFFVGSEIILQGHMPLKICLWPLV